LETEEMPGLAEERMRIRMRMKERTRIKKSLFLSQIYTDLAAMRATLRELMRIMIYNTLFWVYYTCITHILHV
jgi:hypothetical protein